MAAQNVLAHSAPMQTQSPARFRIVRHVYITLLITSGVPSVVAAESDEGLDVADTGTGRYTVSNLPVAGAQRLVHSSGGIESPGTTYAAASVGHNALSLSDGTIELNVLNGTTLTDPTTLSKVRYKLEVAMG